MKPLVIAGIVVAALGAFVLFTGGLSFASQESVLSIGDLEVSAEERHVIPPWVGGAAIVGGLLLVGAGVWRRA